MSKDRDSFTFADFRALPFRQKVEHVLYYYKWYILGGIAAVCLLVSLVTTIFGNRKDVLISGIFINNATTTEGYAHLQDDYWAFCGSDNGTRADLVTARNIDFDNGALTQEDAASFMVVTSMIAARTLDYIITDEASLDDFWEQEVIQDLRAILTDEELSRYDVIEVDGTPVALRLTEETFGYPLKAENSVLIFIGCTQDFEKDANFIRYVFAEE